MEEIKVGEYCRTKYGYIAKIPEIDNYIWFNQKINNESGMAVYELSKIEFTNLVVIHSKNIIDLIENGDYVNGEKVVDIFEMFNNEEKFIGKRLLTEYRRAQYTGIDNRYYTYEQDIKTIVTKEQFKSVEYIVEEE